MFNGLNVEISIIYVQYLEDMIYPYFTFEGKKAFTKESTI